MYPLTPVEYAGLSAQLHVRDSELGELLDKARGRSRKVSIGLWSGSNYN